MSARHGLRFGLLASHSWIALVTFVAMTIVASIGYKQPDLPREWLAKLFPKSSANVSGSGVESEDRDNSTRPRSRSSDRRVESMSLFASDVMMVVTADDFFQPATSKAVREIVDDLNAMPQVANITWLDNAPPLNIFGLPEPALPDYRASAERFKQAREKAIANPLIAGQLLSKDGKTLVLLLEMDWFHVRSNTDCTTKLLAQSAETLASHPNVNMRATLTGDIPMRLRIGDNNKENDRKFQWIVYGGVLLMAGILFRGFAAVIIAALPVAVGVFWAFGFIGFLDMEDNPFNHVVVPVLLSMVGFTDSVHVIAQTRARRSSGLSGRQAIAAAMDDVGVACFLTSLTTAIGFASLWWAHHKVVQEFGICCVLGAAVMFVAVMTTIPLACRTWLARGIQRGDIGGWLERNFYRASPAIQTILKHPKPVAWSAIAITIVTGLMTLQLEPDERAFNGIPEDSPEAIALRSMDKAFGGLETAFVEAVWTHGDEVGNEEMIAISEEIESLLKSEPMLGSPLGLAAIVSSLPGGGTAVEKASLVNLLPPPLKQAFYRPDSRRLIVVFRLQDVGIARYGEVFERVNKGLEAMKQRHSNVSLTLAGSAVFRWENLYRIIVDLAKSLGTASVVIFVVLAVFYRSLRLGLIAVIPNLFPLTVTGAAMWCLGQPLELVSVLAFTVCLGIAVDDTIHFMTRYREEESRTSCHHQVIEKAVLGVGAAMVMTTVVLLAGFSTVLMSDSREHHVFALMGASTIGAALIGDLLFLPALLILFGRSKRKTPLPDNAVLETASV